jgi:hypothetical protein
MLTIIIVTDTPEARKIARERHQEIENELNINVPVVFFDRAKRKLLPYTTEEQLYDARGKSTLIKEALAEQKLLTLEHIIRSKMTWRVRGLLFGWKEDALPPKTARAILEKIEDGKKNASNGRTEWVKAEKEVAELLEKTIKEPSFTQSPDTTEFYKTTYNTHFTPKK